MQRNMKGERELVTFLKFYTENCEFYFMKIDILVIQVRAYGNPNAVKKEIEIFCTISEAILIARPMEAFSYIFIQKIVRFGVMLLKWCVHKTLKDSFTTSYLHLV